MFNILFAELIFIRVLVKNTVQNVHPVGLYGFRIVDNVHYNLQALLVKTGKQYEKLLLMLVLTRQKKNENQQKLKHYKTVIRTCRITHYFVGYTAIRVYTVHSPRNRFRLIISCSSRGGQDIKFGVFEARLRPHCVRSTLPHGLDDKSPVIHLYR